MFSFHQSWVFSFSFLDNKKCFLLQVHCVSDPCHVNIKPLETPIMKTYYPSESVRQKISRLQLYRNEHDEHWCLNNALWTQTCYVDVDVALKCSSKHGHVTICNVRGSKMQMRRGKTRFLKNIKQTRKPTKQKVITKT